MVNPEHFELPQEQILARLQRENDWYRKKYGAVIGKRGLQNWKNLFRWPNIYEWTILFMMILALFMAWAYQHDIEATRENVYRTLINEGTYNPTTDYSNITITNPFLSINEETLKSGET